MVTLRLMPSSLAAHHRGGGLCALLPVRLYIGHVGLLPRLSGASSGFPPSCIHGNGGKALDIEIVIRATFAFDGNPSFDDAEMFLAKEAPSRIMDVVRVYVEELTTMTAFPTLSIPPLSPTVDPRE